MMMVIPKPYSVILSDRPMGCAKIQMTTFIMIVMQFVSFSLRDRNIYFFSRKISNTSMGVFKLGAVALVGSGLSKTLNHETPRIPGCLIQFRMDPPLD